MDLEQIELRQKEIEQKLATTFKTPEYLFCALTHRSYLNEHKDFPLDHNERLEFLGDAVLSLFISSELYLRFPQFSEGDLSFFRSKLVEAPTCVRCVKRLQIEEYLLLGKGERINVGKGRESILADLFESILGALYLDGGMEKVTTFYFFHFKDIFEELLKAPPTNWKALLQDLTQKKLQVHPEYRVVEERGPEHEKEFVVEVFWNETVWGSGVGLSKKEAQQEAAKMAYEAIKKELGAPFEEKLKPSQGEAHESQDPV